MSSADGAAQLRLTDDGETAADDPAMGAVTIGEVLAALKAEFPELTISKIRYYERQGLLTPARSAAGYRKFTGQDVERLRYVLRAARDHYLPLRVIRERLKAAEEQNARARAKLTGASEPSGTPDLQGEPEAGEADSEAGTVAEDTTPGLPEVIPAELARAASGIAAELFSFAGSEERLTRRDLLRESGLTAEQLNELETYGLIAPRGASTSYEAESLTVAKIVAELSRYGLQARHLRPAKAAVDREVGLIEQVLTPLLRQSSRDGRRAAEQQAGEYAALSVRLHVALLEAALRTALR